MSVLYDKIFPIFYLPVKTVLKIFATIGLVGLILVPCVFFLNNPRFSKSVKNFNLTNEPPAVKSILFWTEMPFQFFEEGDLFRECKVSACRVTRDRNFMKIDQFDAVLFHGSKYTASSSDLPSARSSRQKYVFVDLAPPDNHPSDSSSRLPDQFYNWTMTYRRDSDVPMAYGYFVNAATNDVAYPLWAKNNTATYTLRENQISRGDSGRFEGRRKTAAWFPSSCRTAGLGDRYVDELRKYIDVDIYGGCGQLSCEFGDEMCYEMLEGRYHFSIAFEDSLCQDYVTEKLHKAMWHGVVPIVYGAVNYSEFAPAGSFINVADFRGPEDLAKHLKHLITSAEEYERFFWWRKHLFVDVSPRVAFCKMCEMLHDPKSLALSSVFDLGKWWLKRMCLDPFKFLESVIRI